MGPEEAEDVTLVFGISDTGQGMTEEQISRLFDEYSRFNLRSNRSIEGVGLGMSITRKLVRMMNGEILVESELGRGTTFTVRLLQGNIDAEPLGPEVVEQLRQFRINDTTQMKRTEIIREHMPYGSVLIVDDVVTNLYVAKGLMAPYDLAIDTVESGFEGIEKIKQGKVYDIVFMDHMMPGMDGIETTEAMRGLGYTQPVIALTADAMIGRAEKFQECGFDDCITKPIDLRQLNAVLNKFVRDRHPPEVVNAARQQKKDVGEQHVGATPQAFISPNLVKMFMRDASKSLAVLEALHEQQDSLSDTGLRTYVINVHGMKSALANIGELGLSALAAKLEQAGRDRDSAVMSSQTPAFLNALRELIEEITPKEDNEASGTTEITDEDMAYLREKLLALKTACVSYDKKSAKDILAEIEQKAWPRPTKERLEAIAEHLLHSKFKAAISVVDDMIAASTKIQATAD